MRQRSRLRLRPAKRYVIVRAVRITDPRQTEVSVEVDGSYVEKSASGDVRARNKLETAEISLNDCLACSGCVTSAESVLVGMQSIDQVTTALREQSDKLFVATLSPQSLASLAERLAFDAQQASVSAPPPQVLFFRIAFAMRELGFHAVMDSTFARHLALREHLREFFERRDAKQRGTEPSLPMLASACPGWICYAEKAHAELLPYVARTKSPQQVAGVLAKRLVGPHLHHAHRGADVPYSATSVYHVAVMPCYDKKLEASRREFEDERSGSKEVDCVLTPAYPRPVTLAELQAEPVKRNSDLGYYTNFMNMLDYAAVAVPAATMHNGLPWGVTLFGRVFTDQYLLSLADALQHQTGLKLIGGNALITPPPRNPARNDRARLVVCGAHLDGLPLNWQLRQRGGRLLETTRSSPDYKLYALAGGPPLRPGMVRVAEGGAAVEVEVWELPSQELGSFLTGIPAPLGLGKVQLADGRWETGFICEPYGLDGAQDITELGGWRTYLKRRS